MPPTPRYLKDIELINSTEEPLQVIVIYESSNQIIHDIEASSTIHLMRIIDHGSWKAVDPIKTINNILILTKNQNIQVNLNFIPMSIEVRKYYIVSNMNTLQLVTEDIMHDIRYDDIQSLLYHWNDYEISNEEIILEAMKLQRVHIINFLLDEVIFSVSILGQCLIIAIIFQQRELINRLVSLHADINVTYDGNTALFEASWRGYVDDVRQLIDLNANISFQTDEGLTPIIVASQYGRIDIVNLLLSHGANINDIDKLGDSALSYAVKYGKFEMSIELIRHHADINNISKEGNSPLMYICNDRWGRYYSNPLHRIELCKELIKCGADASIVKKHFEDPQNQTTNQDILLILQNAKWIQMKEFLKVIESLEGIEDIDFIFNSKDCLRQLSIFF